MLTPRGWWFLVLTLTVGGIGGVMATRGSPTLLTVSLALVMWFGAEWAVFLTRARLTAGRLRVERTVRDEQGPLTTLWVGRAYAVDVAVRLPRGRLPWVVLDDRPPAGVEFVDGTQRYQGAVSAKEPAVISYRIRGSRLGLARFEGVRVRMADLQGYFCHEVFLREPVEVPVLPVIAETALTRRADKRFNLLPPPGVHRHRRPGTGSELLELRDYRPGDPPRRIAWKVSARRDTLITREYESEVPIRCTLFVDASSATRVGPAGASALTGLCEIAATVAESAIANRDLIGLAVCDDDGDAHLTPARTPTHLVTILERLARVAPLQPIMATQVIGELLPRAYALATALYPELMNPAVNRFPVWLPWLSPPPVYRVRRGRNPQSLMVRRWRQLLSAPFRRRLARRKRLAAMLTAKDDLPPAAVAVLLEDDAAFSMWAQRLLAEHRVPYAMPAAIAGPAALAHQARALVRAVGRGRDNELYVLMGDYRSRLESLAELLRAVQVARARHHQVLVIQTGQAMTAPADRPVDASATDLIAYSQATQAEREWRTLRRAFGRLGALVLPAGSGDPARLILRRIEQLRALQGAGNR